VAIAGQALYHLPDFGAVKSFIIGVRISHTVVDGTQGVDVQTSDDNSVWNTIVTYGSGGGTRQNNFGVLLWNGRYIRINCRALRGMLSHYISAGSR